MARVRRLPFPRRAGLCLLAGLALTAGASCQRGAGTNGAGDLRPRALIVVGVDGFEWSLVRDMVRGGTLPEIASLAADGVAATLATLAPTISPPVWTSMATGVVPERHGILGFVHPLAAGSQRPPRLFTNRDRRVKALWNIAGDAGLRSCVVGYWMTLPAEPVHGVMVAQTALPPGSRAEPTRKGSLREGVAGQVYPPSYEERAFELARRSSVHVATREKELYGDTSAWPPSMQRLVEHSRWSLAADTAYQHIALDLLATRPHCDVLLVYLGLPDVLGHRFWRWSRPGDFEFPPDAAEVEAYGGVLRRAYQQVDRFVGRVRRRAGPKATVVVVSDHGMGPFRPGARVDVARRDGKLLRTGGHSPARDSLFVAAGPGIVAPPDEHRQPFDAELPRPGTVLDVAPTLLALLGLPRGADMDGSALATLLDPLTTAAVARDVDTYTPAGWQASRSLLPEEDPAASQRLEQLRGLGYLD